MIEDKSEIINPVSMEITTDTLGSLPIPTKKKNLKRKNRNHSLALSPKRFALPDMVFFDGNRHPASVLHELRPEISPDKYHFQLEESPQHQPRFRCSITIEKDLSEPIIAVGSGRSKQSAKNMAAQVTIIFYCDISNSKCFRIIAASFDQIISNVSTSRKCSINRKL